MTSELEIREELIRLLTKEISLDEFESWLVRKSWNAHLDSAPAALRLAYAVELRLAEYSSGHLSRDELTAQLLPFVQQYQASGPGLPIVETGSSCVIESQIPLTPLFDTPRVVVFG